MKPPRLSPVDALYIGLGGALGSLLRTWTGQGFEGLFPVSTIFINVLGTIALAVLHASQHRIHARGKYLYMVGFCGSFTTVSLFSYETVILFQSGNTGLALANILIPVGLGLGLAWLLVDFMDKSKEPAK